MPQWPQDAHPVEGVGAARLGKFAAGLAGNRRMIQIAAQIRILVAVEAIDGRKGIDAIAMPGKTERGSIFRLPVYLPDAPRHGHPSLAVRFMCSLQ
jgi:hypothetical protein